MQIHTFERKVTETAPSLVFNTPGGTKAGWVAEVEVLGFRLFVSLLDGEREWVTDGVFDADKSFPVTPGTFWNGWFSRCTILKHPTQVIADGLFSKLAAVEHDRAAAEVGWVR